MNENAAPHTSTEQQPVAPLSIEEAYRRSCGTLHKMLRVSQVVGGVYQQDYDRAVVVTDDFHKQKVGGVPRTSFLLAATTTGVGEDMRLDEPEVILLRVRGAAALPNEADLMSLRMHVVREAYTQGSAWADIQDPQTVSSLQQSALDCEVMGTFYADESTGQIVFGTDVDNVYSAARYRVFVPSQKVLSWIASYPKVSADGSELTIPIGVVRYAATRRKAIAAHLAEAAVHVHVSDFVARKTSVLGMTRSGKAFPLSQVVPVPPSEKFPAGWATVGALAEGDLVYSLDGTETPVIGLSEIHDEDVFTLRFSDHSEVTTSGNHLWSVVADPIPLLAQASPVARDQDDMLAWAAYLGAGTYATAADLERLTGCPAAMLRALAQANGVEEHTSEEVDGTRLYPAAELLTRVADGGATRVVSTTQIAAAPDAEWLLPPRPVVQVDPGVCSSRGTVEDRHARLEASLARYGVPGDSGPMRRMVFDHLSLASGHARLIASLGGVPYLRVIPDSGIESVPSGTRATTDVGGALAGSSEAELAASMSRHPAGRARRGPRVEVAFHPAMTDRLRVIDVRPAGRTRTRCITVAHPSSTFLVGDYVPTHNSNTIKTICTAVYRYAAEADRKIGQVLFDPQGEYANVNQQDGTGLRLLGDEDKVRIYKVNPDPALPQEKPLRLDFYDVDMIDVAWGLTTEFLSAENAAYIEKFCNVDLASPERSDFPAGPGGDKDFGSAQRAVARARLAFYALLSKCGFAGSAFNGSAGPVSGNGTGSGSKGRPKIVFQMTATAAADAAQVCPSLITVKNGTYAVDNPKAAQQVVTWISENLEGRGDLSSWTECDPFMAIREVVRRGSGIALAKLSSLRDFHDNTARAEVNEAVWEDMRAGRMSIVDLSVGNPEVTARIAERIVNHLLERASERFRTGQSPVPMQVIVEEAHNLFDRSAAESVRNPWVRLSKEAAKYSIGLVYATQEVTSVDRRILSNTSNWVIAHLNSNTETTELGRYYDFEVFAESLRRVDEKGFVRLKTYSGKYIVPVQIALFDHAMINAARAAAGLPEINVDGSLADGTTSDWVDEAQSVDVDALVNALAGDAADGGADGGADGAPTPAETGATETGSGGASVIPLSRGAGAGAGAVGGEPIEGGF